MLTLWVAAWCSSAVATCPTKCCRRRGSASRCRSGCPALPAPGTTPERKGRQGPRESLGAGEMLKGTQATYGLEPRCVEAGHKRRGST